MTTERLHEVYGPSIITRSQWLQSIGAVAFLTFWTMPIIGTFLTAYVALCTKYWYIAILYCAWIYYDRHTPKQGGRRLDYNWPLPFARWFSSYFPVTCVKTHNLDPSKNHILACHPHGVLVCGVLVGGVTEANNFHQAFPGHKTYYLTLNTVFYIPILRDFILSFGGCSVSREGMQTVLRYPGGGRIAVMVPGGSREVLHSHPGENTVLLKNRKGFIRAAIENGANLVPVYSFGETDTYGQLANPEGSRLRKFQERVHATFGIAPAVVSGRGLFGLLPRRVPINVVVGTPIEVEQNSCPTVDDVNTLHERYMVALTDLYYTYRGRYGNLESKLNII